jgi:predicted RNase H-like nuclease (RuvC/YqgF family)
VNALYLAQGAAPVLAFYEVGAPLRPNHLVDISAVADSKRQAMATFESQLAQQRYDVHIAALNTFRTYTVAGDVAAVEALIVVGADQLEGWLSTYAQAGAPGMAQITEAALQKADEDLVALTRTVQGLNDTVEAQAREIAKIPGLVDGLRQTQAQLESARREVQDRDRQLAHAARELADAGRALDDVFASRSWRITRPLRWLSEKLRQS